MQAKQHHPNLAEKCKSTCFFDIKVQIPTSDGGETTVMSFRCNQGLKDNFEKVMASQHGHAFLVHYASQGVDDVDEFESKIKQLAASITGVDTTTTTSLTSKAACAHNDVHQELVA